MRIKTKFSVLSLISGGAVIAFIGSLWGYHNAETDLAGAYDQKYQSYALADGFRQSSDDLTRLVRTYAETGDASYKEQYNAVVDIRNGTRPRPEDYHRIYWDFVAGGEAKPRPDGIAISMQDLMKQAGFTEEEFALLDEAKKRSDALIKLETEAMNLVENIKTLGPDAKAKATSLLNSPDYHRFKSDVMKPVDAFFVALEKRTQGAVEEAGDRANSYWMITSISLSVLVLMLLIVGYTTFRTIIGGMYKLRHAMKLVESGQLDTAIGLQGSNDEIGEMAAAIETFRENALNNKRLEQEAAANRSATEDRRLAEQQRMAHEAEQLRIATGTIGQNLKRLAAGDLTCQIRTQFSEEYEDLRSDFNVTVDQLNQTMAAVLRAVTSMDTGTREIASGANDLSKRTEQQAASLEETAAALDEITSNVTSSSKLTEEGRHIAQAANQSAAQSADVVSQAETAMERIEESSQQISNIIGVIDEIAFQTNLLALNAGVEAARAGEAGKGFAVVAQEVRELAQRSAQAAKEIKGLIHNSTSEVENGVKLVRDTGIVLKTIGEYIGRINNHMQSIAVSAQEQSLGLTEVNVAVNQMDQITQQNAAMVEQSTAAVATLASEADHLKKLVNGFVLGEAAPGQANELRKVAAVMSNSARTSESSPHSLKIVSGGKTGSTWEEF